MPEEIKVEVVQKTQKTLGKFVKRPQLTDKLLKKPPFRFLHDIVNVVIKDTGFLKGLFTDEELNSDNVKERDAKIAFLSKLIDAVKTITGTELSVRPSKIIAGLEPAETNLLLQTIAKAIEKKLDSSDYVNLLNSGNIIIEKKPPKSKIKDNKEEKLKKPSKPVAKNEEKVQISPRSKEKKRTPSIETPKSTDRSKTKRSSKETKGKTDESKPKSKDSVKPKEKLKDAEPQKILDEPIIKNEDKTELLKKIETNEPPLQNIPESPKIPPANLIIQNTEPAISETEQKENTEVVLESHESAKKRTASATRPKSARPKSGELKEKTDAVKVVSTPIESRPKSTLRPPSVRPSSARPGAPRLRPDSALPIQETVAMGKINVIVESFDKDADEEETVVIQSNAEIVEEPDENVQELYGENKGHLVEQILEQINDADAVKTKVDIDWQKDGLLGKESTSKETGNLRTLIQNLTKTANPLGKLLNYLHEDIDAMHAELESWTNTKRQLFAEIVKQKKISAEMNKPLLLQLDNLNNDIRKLEEEIVTARSNILRNDSRIKELMIANK